MFKNHAYIYAVEKPLANLSHMDRIQRVRTKLNAYGTAILRNTDGDGDEAEGYVLDEVGSTSELERIINDPRFTDPIIAVGTIADVSNLEAATMILNNGISLIVADNLKMPSSSYLNKHIKDGFIQSGPVMIHIINMADRLRVSIENRKTPNEDGLNNARKAEARKFAESIWPHMLEAVEKLGSPNKTKIAQWLNANGYRTATGYNIKGSQLARYAKALDKEDEWNALLDVP